MIRIVLAEDQALLRGALAGLLALESDIDVVAEAGDGDSAWKAVQQHQPDLLLTDIEMPGLTGLDLAAKVQEAKLATRVVIVTTFARGGYLRRALDAGVRGYLRRHCATSIAAAAPSPPNSPSTPGAKKRIPSPIANAPCCASRARG
jgi:two-component system response regulator DesR